MGGPGFGFTGRVADKKSRNGWMGIEIKEYICEVMVRSRSVHSHLIPRAIGKE
jgi:hypothetical protein